MLHAKDSRHPLLHVYDRPQMVSVLLLYGACPLDMVVTSDRRVTVLQTCMENSYSNAERIEVVKRMKVRV